MDDKLTIYASLPPIASAVTIGGDQATRIKLDVPASELPQVLKLVAFYAGKSFKVTVEPDES
jgi:hypothetical protein